MKKLLKVLGFLFLALILLVGIGIFFFNEKKPTGIAGEKAEALAQKMLQAINKPAWDSTNIIGWTFGETHHHLWDKRRNLVQVEWKNHKALIDLNKMTGKTWENQEDVRDATKNKELIQEAWEYFINDAFWLNPVVKIYDSGVDRSIVNLPNGTEGLLVSYKSGGVTPGDSYLWILDANGLPTAWKMWVKIIPIGGLETTWADWKALPTGAKVAQAHNIKGIGVSIPLTDIKAATSLEAFGLKQDPFLDIL